MDNLMKQQNALEAEINVFKRNYDKTSKSRHSIGYLKGRINGIEPIWQKFRENHLEIVIKATKDDEGKSYFTNNLYESVEELYYDLQGTFADALTEISSKEMITATNNTTTTTKLTHNELKLPTINIPTFNGSYLSWTSFKDLFTTLVHNNESLTNVQKLHYLKCNVSGEAEQILRHLSITEANYQTAWKALLDRYENKRILVDAQLALLLNQPPVTKENSHQIKRLLDTTNECLHSLKNLGLQIECWDPIIIYLTVKKLPNETYQLWESKIEGNKETPKLSHLQTFLEGRFQTLERISDQQKHVVKDITSKPLNSIYRKSIAKSFHTSTTVSCALCRKAHTVRQCPEYLKLSPQQRQDLAKSKGLCFNCLSHRHHTAKCESISKCYICGMKHHTLLHITKTTHHGNQGTALNIPGTLQPASMNPQESTSTGFHTYHTIESSSKCVLLATALVNVQSATGDTLTLRALIDQGSQASFITEDAAQKLQVKRQSVLTSITGLNSNKPVKSRGLIQLNIASYTQKSDPLQVNLLVISSITNLLPPYALCNQNWNYLKGLILADPTYWKPGKIDILLGADIYAEILLNGIIKGPIGTPLAQRTTLGWILSGASQINTEQKNVVTLLSRDNLDSSLRQFWEIEEIHPERKRTADEITCEEAYQKSIRRNKDGRYTVSLPFKSPSGQSTALGRSRNRALKRFLCNEAKLKRNPLMLSEYNTCLQEYLDLGHMKLITTSENDHCGKNIDNTIYFACCYLPHHGVTKDSSTTTKLRIVFDASCKTSSGVSLNEELLVGPTIQDELIQILLRWRIHKVAFTADIAKMYRQIKITENDAEFQRILWRPSPDEEIKDYKLLTVTFGTSSAPYLAIRTLQQLAKDEEKNFPLAANIVRNDFYVDDLMSGADSAKEAIELYQQLINLTKAGGFQLRKWTSNCKELLQKIPSSELELNLPLTISVDLSVKTLGTYWNPMTDTFIFQLSLPPIEGHITKRKILSDIARLFDPLGWISPTLITAKIFMQRLWLKGLTWDQTVPEEVSQKWLRYREDLQYIENIKIPRWVGTKRRGSVCELHGFCDASQRAYAAVLYLRTCDFPNHIVNLLISKTRVAPLKEISLPRLELCGAVLLTRLFKKVSNSLGLPISSIYAWTDSTIVISWIRGHPNRWKSFVANRVTEITTTLKPDVWRHITSEQNPADCATRGITPETLEKSSIWWHGPQWLRKASNEWPFGENEFPETKEEEKTTNTFLIHKENDELSIMTRYSSLTKLIRVTAYCCRFINNGLYKLRKQEREREWLKPRELRDALHKLCLIAQTDEFSEEQNSLRKHSTISPKSRLLSLNPFIDQEGLLRVGGRLHESHLSFSEKHPIILTSKHPFTKLVIDFAHQTTLHGGVLLTLSYLRKKYWIINARNVVRHHIHKCTKCFRQIARPNSQLMGNLPRPRLQITRPFTHTGIDYAGPIDIRVSKGRGNKSYKGYISLFICLSTKGIHLETVSDMTSNAFLAAFRRFVSRRGLPSHLYSDCGTNFIGAKNQLAKEFWQSKQNNKEMAEILANDGIDWHFIPPASPHFGGLWEAGVKSMKHHLKRILGGTTLTFEELTTLLCQIEACLNSRPLCPITTDPTDLNILTPGHFQIGTAPITPVEPTLIDFRTHTLSRWQYIQKMYHDFWKIWSGEYLNRLQQRPKWNSKQTNIQKDELVLIKDERMPPCKWLLGRIIETHPGKDGLVRVVTVKTANSIMKRPITKICSLPSSSEMN